MVRRNTFQRSTVLDAVKTLKNHATADEVYEEAKAICPSISRTTVYRNLQQLCEMGEIQKVNIPGSPDRFDHVTTDHYHVMCTACGKIADAEMDFIPDLHSKIKDTHGYTIDEHRIVFAGMCPECQARKEKKRTPSASGQG